MEFMVTVIFVFVVIFLLLVSFSVGFYLGEKGERKEKPRITIMSEEEKDKMRRFEHEMNNFLSFDGEKQKEYGEK